MSNERDLYEIPEIWVDGFLPEENLVRVTTVLQKMPVEVNTLLDVGCGGGIFVNYVSSNYPNRFKRLVGTDRSIAALAEVKVEKYQSSADALPFCDREFDLALCMEVIEHLPHGVYDKGLRELARVAARYIVVTVPYRQNLRRSQTECPKCLTRFEPNYHMRSFDEKVMRSLFDNADFKCVDIFRMNPIPYYWGISHLNAWRTRIRENKKFPETTICPVCGYNRTSEIKKKVPRVLKRRNVSVKTLLKKVWPHTDVFSWIGAIYVRDKTER